MTMLAIVLAQAGGEKSGSSPLGILITFLPLAFLFYFMLIRPQKQRSRQQQELMRAIDVGDEVETIGGIYGTIRRAEEDVLWIEIAPGTEIKVSRGAVRRKVYEEDEETSDSEETTDAES